MIEDQIKVIDFVVNLNKRFNKKIVIDNNRYLVSAYHSDEISRISFRNIDEYCQDYLIIDYYPKLDYLEIVLNTCDDIDNIRKILYDYKQMDINQFILVYGRDPLKMNDLSSEVFVAAKLIKVLSQSKIKRFFSKFNPLELLKKR